MKFKHSLNVLIDNFNLTYKVLLYRLIILLFCACLYTAVIVPFILDISSTDAFANLSAAIAEFGSAFANLDFDKMQDEWVIIREDVRAMLEALGSMQGTVVLTAVIILVVYIVQRFLLGLGNFTAGAIINDKMAMRANSPFIGTLIKNLGKASLYNVIYVPISTVYDIVVFSAAAALAVGLNNANTPILLIIFIFSVLVVFLHIIKMTFTSDWLPSLVYGKMTNRGAISYSFDYTAGEKHFGSVLSNYVVLVLIIFAANVAAVLLTFGAGLLITLPASYVFLICFEFVNYCDNNEIKYFADKNTVIKPEREPVMTREKFFKGEDGK